MKIVGANPNPKIVGTDELPGRSNYFIGNDPKKWRTNVANYAKVEYANVYPGVDWFITAIRENWNTISWSSRALTRGRSCLM
jgi:hypothetical protein